MKSHGWKISTTKHEEESDFFALLDIDLYGYDAYGIYNDIDFWRRAAD